MGAAHTAPIGKDKLRYLIYRKTKYLSILRVNLFPVANNVATEHKLLSIFIR